MLPVTLARVPHRTSNEINAKIRNETERRVDDACTSGADAVHDRLHELREEWDIDRAVELHGGAVAIAGTALAFVNKRFLALPIAVGASLALGALFGWSPQYAVLRRFGCRTAGEIERERHLLLQRSKSLDLSGAEDIILDDDDLGDEGRVAAEDFDDADADPNA
ncbi:MAG TPA: DUF2892 domain-containing protein [Myxococcota bacterium]